MAYKIWTLSYGLFATVGSTIISMQDIESGLRIISLIIGIAIGILSLRKLWVIKTPEKEKENTTSS